MSTGIPLWIQRISFCCKFSWQMLTLQKHSYKFYLLQTTSTKLMHPTGYSTYQVANGGNKYKLVPWVSCITTNSSVSAFKKNIVANFNKLGHFFSFTHDLGSYVKSSSKPSEHHFPLLLHSMTHEKAGSLSPYLR